MAFDALIDGDRWNSFHGPVCRSCRQPIGQNDARESVRFDIDPEGKLKELSGLYHAACARPFRNLANICNMGMPRS